MTGIVNDNTRIRHYGPVFWLVGWLGLGLCAGEVAAQPRGGRETLEAAPMEAGVDEADPQAWDVPPDTPATTDGGATLNPLLLEPVRDNTIGLEYVDRPAYYYGLWLCQQIEGATIAKFAQAHRDERQIANPRFAKLARSQFPQFVDVFQNPAEYRGRPVTLSGYFRKLVKYPADKNDLGITHVYEGWIYTADSQSNPAVVVFTQKPDLLPLGGDITEEVQFTGYFLKLYGYSAQDTTRRAPMFVAGTVNWRPARAANERTATPAWVYGGITAIGLLAIYGVIQLGRRKERSLSRFHSPGRDFDAFPPQEFVGDGDRPVEPFH
jgi:hypothetical protein